MGRNAWLLCLLLVGCNRVRDTEQLEAIDKAATQLEEAGQELQSTTRDYAQVQATDFKQLDLGWYDRTDGVLTGLGFVRLKDIADVGHNQKHPETATFMRLLLSSDGHTMASLFQFGEQRVVDFETETEQGRFVCTINAPAMAEFDYGTLVETSAKVTGDATELYATHQEHLGRYAQAHAHGPLRVLRTYDDFMASQARMQQLKGTYRKARQIPFTEKELQGITHGRYSETTRLVAEELRQRYPSN
jgi:hypothetical protein